MNPVSIRQMVTTDVGVAMALKEAEGWNQTESDWLFFLKHNPELCLVACMEGKVVGTVTAINYNNVISWIGMMLVHRNSRGQGVGKLLLQTVIKKLRSGDSIKLDATPAGRPVYQKLGFVEELELNRMVAPTLKSLDQPDFLKVLPVRDVDIPDITDFDSSIFGTSRPELIRYLVKNKPEHCYCIREGEQLSGFALMRKGTRFNHIGPIQAVSFSDAKLLISNLLLQTQGEPVVLDILADKLELRNWLEEVGFTCQRSLTRMYLGGIPERSHADMNFAISGPELG
jgi:predicted N-acetyltransferase YhbS